MDILMRGLSIDTLSKIPTFRKKMAYVPFAKGVGGYRIGVAPLPDDKPWFEFDEDYDVQTLLKRELLNSQHVVCYREFSGTEHFKAVKEVSGAIADWLLENHEISMKGWERSNLWAVSQYVQDDLCIMQKNKEGKWVMTAASVCFPTSWDLHKMMGKTSAVIHAEIGNESFRDALDKKMDEVGEKLLWRTNWFLYDAPDIRHDFPNKLYERDWYEEDLNSRNVGSKLFLRYERQTLRRFPETGAVLFTIRPYVDPLRTLKEEHPEHIGDFVRAYDKHKTYGAWCTPMYNYLGCVPHEV